MRSLFFGGVLALALVLGTSPPTLADPLDSTGDALAQLAARTPSQVIPAPLAVANGVESALPTPANDTGNECHRVALPDNADTPATLTDPVSLASSKPRLQPPNVSRIGDGWAYFGDMRSSSVNGMHRFQMTRFDPAAHSLRRCNG